MQKKVIPNDLRTTKVNVISLIFMRNVRMDFILFWNRDSLRPLSVIQCEGVDAFDGAKLSMEDKEAINSGKCVAKSTLKKYIETLKKLYS